MGVQGDGGDAFQGDHFASIATKTMGWLIMAKPGQTIHWGLWLLAHDQQVFHTCIIL